MKKSIIAAGAASVALAAMAVLGAFAATSSATVTDNLSVTLDTTCSLTETGAVQGTSGQTGVTTGPTVSSATTAGATYSITMSTGKVAELGTSTLHIVCNDTTNGYDVTGTFADLKLGGSSSATGVNAIPYTDSVVTDGTSGWNVFLGSGTTPLTSAAAGNIYNAKTSKESADTTVNVTYKVGSSTTNTPGEYTGTATYVLTWGA